jgi:carbon storage regulator
MLVLTRQRDEVILIRGGTIEIIVVDIREDKVRLGVNAPQDMSIHRAEIYEIALEQMRNLVDLNDEGILRLNRDQVYDRAIKVDNPKTLLQLQPEQLRTVLEIYIEDVFHDFTVLAMNAETMADLAELNIQRKRIEQLRSKRSELIPTRHKKHKHGGAN